MSEAEGMSNKKCKSSGGDFPDTIQERLVGDCEGIPLESRL